MIYLNSALPPLLKYSIPDFYQTVSVKDFVDERLNIQVPSIFRGLHPVALLLPLSVLYPFQSIISFSNTDIYREGDFFRISDMIGEVRSSLHPYKRKTGIKNFQKGRQHEILCTYMRSRDKLFVLGTEKLGPPQRERRAFLGLARFATCARR